MVPYVLLTVGPAVVDLYCVLIVYLSHLHLQQSISCGFPYVFLTVAPTVVDLFVSSLVYFLALRLQWLIFISLVCL